MPRAPPIASATRACRSSAGSTRACLGRRRSGTWPGFGGRTRVRVELPRARLLQANDRRRLGRTVGETKTGGTGWWSRRSGKVDSAPCFGDATLTPLLGLGSPTPLFACSCVGLFACSPHCNFGRTPRTTLDFNIRIPRQQSQPSATHKSSRTRLTDLCDQQRESPRR